MKAIDEFGIIDISTDSMKSLSSEMKYDLETGVYDNYPVAKKEVERMAEMLSKCIYVINACEGPIDLRKAKFYGYEINE